MRLEGSGYLWSPRPQAASLITGPCPWGDDGDGRVVGTALSVFPTATELSTVAAFTFVFTAATEDWGFYCPRCAQKSGTQSGEVTGLRPHRWGWGVECAIAFSERDPGFTLPTLSSLPVPLGWDGPPWFSPTLLGQASSSTRSCMSSLSPATRSLTWPWTSTTSCAAWCGWRPCSVSVPIQLPPPNRDPPRHVPGRRRSWGLCPRVPRNLCGGGALRQQEEPLMAVASERVWGAVGKLGVR